MSHTKSYAALSATTALEAYSFDRRTLGENDVQVEILYCGVCHSDLHQAKNEWGGSIYPMVPGHEIVGKVSAVGSSVSKFKIGDLAGVGVMIDSCKTCKNCQENLEQYCAEGMTGTYNAKERNGTGVTMGGPTATFFSSNQYAIGNPSTSFFKIHSTSRIVLSSLKREPVRFLISS